MEREKFVEVTLYQIYKSRTTARPRDWKPTQWYNQPNWSYELWFNLPKWEFNWVPWESNGISIWYYGIWSAWNDIYNRQYIYINGFVQELRICTCNEKHDDKPWDFSNFPMFRWWRRYLQPASGLIFNTGKGLGVLSNCLGQQCVHWNNPRVDKGLKPRMWSSKTPKPMLPSYSRWSLADGMQNQHGSKILSRKWSFDKIPGHMGF